MFHPKAYSRTVTIEYWLITSQHDHRSCKGNPAVAVAHCAKSCQAPELFFVQKIHLAISLLFEPEATSEPYLHKILIKGGWRVFSIMTKFKLCNDADLRTFLVLILIMIWYSFTNHTQFSCWDNLMLLYFR